METPEQAPFGGYEFIINAERRCPCLLLLDRSTSMTGLPIRELNAGLVQLKEELLADPMAAKRIELAVLSFGPVKLHGELTTPDQFVPPLLVAGGGTPMGEAIEEGIRIVAERKAIYKNNGIQYYRPWIFLITDGEPTDTWTRAASLVREGETNESFQFFAVGVGGANMGTLAKISPRDPLKLQGLRFRELFLWLSSSMRAVSASKTKGPIPLKPTSDWSTAHG